MKSKFPYSPFGLLNLCRMRGKSKVQNFDDIIPKENAVSHIPTLYYPLILAQILVFGDLLNIGQYVIYELAEKGFNIRVIADDMKSTINLLGLPGNNVDILRLNKDSPLTSYLKAAQGCQAVIFCGNFEPKPNLVVGSCRDYNEVALRLLDIICEGKKKKSVDVQKVVLVSRATDTSNAIQGNNPLQAFLNIQGPLYSKYRQLTDDLEDSVRQSGIEYAIVRAAPEVLQTRQGSRYELVLSQRQISGSNFVGVLDLAECATQALLLDIAGVTFTVSEMEGLESNMDLPLISSKNNEEAQATMRSEVTSSRVPRRAYYSILDMGDEDMRSSYMMRPQEEYVAQIEEDRLVEKYWSSKFSPLVRDPKN